MYQLITVALLTLAVASQCPSADPLCSKCNGSACVACINSYPDLYGRCIEMPSRRVPNCYHYYQSGRCLICASGFMRDENFECMRIAVTNCSMADDSGRCTICNKNLRVANNTCTESVKCSRPNCERCFENDSCYECAPGYYLSYEGNCVANTAQVTDCRNVDVRGNCIICKENYYDMNGKCISVKSGTIVRAFLAIGMVIGALVG